MEWGTRRHGNKCPCLGGVGRRIRNSGQPMLSETLFQKSTNQDCNSFFSVLSHRSSVSTDYQPLQEGRKHSWRLGTWQEGEHWAGRLGGVGYPQHACSPGLKPQHQKRGQIRYCLPLSCCKLPKRKQYLEYKINSIKEIGVKCFGRNCWVETQ